MESNGKGARVQTMSKTTKKKPAQRKKKALVIVESPAKARTINKYLGKDFVVKASMGHVRDLPKGKFGIDLERGFEPEASTRVPSSHDSSPSAPRSP